MVEVIPISFLQYQRASMRTARKEELVAALVHASLGLASEAGEFTSEVKRMSAYSKVMSAEMKAHMLEELGDTLWYIALACDALGADMGTVAFENVNKLRKRFPDKFTNDAAEARADKGGLSHTES